ncbi:MAG: FAD-binding dehydrogenase [Pseudonocardiales bacterium]|nr:FAD-binding oxidoreductase [Actinomycetota bacterium]PZS11434.1 MAG: FAD-binding dehydrogenase [Pseudonocardiales bacterium]
MPLNRRAFLHAAGLSATAAALTGCGGAHTTSPPRASGSAGAAHKLIGFPGLARKLSGPLVTPDKPGYHLARRSFNPLFDNRTPAAIAQCRRIEDVQACVAAAAAAGAPIAARSGGHSYAGYSTPDGALVADLSGLSSVLVNADGTAVIGAGARLIDIYTALGGAGRCLPAGTCPSVGIAGLTLGGGVGVVSRKYGLTCDRLVSATVVTADGTSRTVSASADPDLFWALRGGGGGNFGIVTSLTFDTVPAPQLTVFLLGFPAGAVPDVLGGWQDWIISMPDELSANCHIIGGSPPSCTVIGCYIGSARGLNPLLSGLIGRIGSQPTLRTVAEHGYLDGMRYFAGCSAKSAAECHDQASGRHWNREAFVASSRVLTAPVADPAQISSVFDGRTVFVIIDGLGGAISRVTSADTAFPHRGALALMQIYLRTSPADRAAAASSVVQMRDQLTGVVGGGAYVNYIDHTLPNWAHAYYGDNLTRLRQAAQRYDPDRLFTFPQAIANS